MTHQESHHIDISTDGYNDCHSNMSTDGHIKDVVEVNEVNHILP